MRKHFSRTCMRSVLKDLGRATLRAQRVNLEQLEGGWRREADHSARLIEDTAAIEHDNIVRFSP
jgi:hypothetical protein